MPRSQRSDISKISKAEDYKSIGKKAVYTGAIAAVGSYLFLDERGTSPLIDFQVPSAIAVAAGSAVGSVTGDLLSDFVIDKMTSSNSIRGIESTAVKIGLSGAGTVVGLKLMSGFEPSVQGFGLGCVSKALGDYSYDKVDPLAMLF